MNPPKREHHISDLSLARQVTLAFVAGVMIVVLFYACTDFARVGGNNVPHLLPARGQSHGGAT